MNFLKNTSFKMKIMFLCGLLLSITIVVGVVAYRGLNQVQTINESVVGHDVPGLLMVNGMALTYRTVRIELRTLGIEGLTPSLAEKAYKSTVDAINQYEEINKKFAASLVTKEEEVLYQELNQNWIQFKAIGDRALKLYKSGSAEDRKELLRIFYEDCVIAADKYKVSLDKMIEYQTAYLSKDAENSLQKVLSVNKTLIILTLLGVILGFSIAFLLSNSINQSIKAIVDALKASSEEVSVTSTQMATTSEELSATAVQQASSLQQTSSSLTEINSMISSNSDNAKNSESASHESLEIAEKGKEVVGQMLEAIGDISTSNEEIMRQMNENNKEMKELVAVISEIGNKTKIINDIVFQTKLLSFNASVEAARAGEHGKGFAVVAEEVGKLAALSGAASVEINELLEKSIKKVEETVQHSTEKVTKLIHNGKLNIDKGNHVAAECREVLNEIVDSVSEVTKRVSEIAVASKEQSLGVQEITKAISQLDQVTQINSNNSTESAKAAEKLSSQACNLRKQVANLVATIEGQNSEAVKEMQQMQRELECRENELREIQDAA